jgi:exopolysaccharide production protein ExoQ
MNGVRQFFEWSVLGGCAFILTQALLVMVLAPGDTPVDGNPLWRVILATSYLCVAAILVWDYRGALLAVRRNWFVTALTLLALVSCLWAQTPTLVLQRSIAVFGATLFGIALAVRLSLEEQLRLMSWVFRTIAVLSLACIVLLPRYGISDWPHQGDWRGIFGHKNGLGAYMALSVLVEWHLPTETRTDKVLNLSALLLSAVLVVFSNSITSIVTLTATLIFIWIYKLARQRLRLPLFAIVSAMFLVIASGVTMLLVDSDIVTTALGRSSNLTGRTEIWRWVISFILERPVLGYGFSGFWGGASDESFALNRRLGVPIMYSHNGYLDILLTLGLVGFALVLVFLGTGTKRAFDRSERNESSVDLWPLAFLFLFMLHNMAECTILFQDLEWSLCIATVVGADTVLFAPAEQQEQSILVPSEELA